MAKNRGAKKPTVVVDKNAAQFIRTAANLARKYAHNI